LKNTGFLWASRTEDLEVNAHFGILKWSLARSLLGP